MIKVKITKTGIVSALALTSILAAYIYGLLGQEQDFEQSISEAFPQMTIESKTGNDPIYFKANFPEGQKYLVLKKTMGWGGPAIVATQTDTLGFIEEVVVIRHQETPSFFTQLVNNSFFDQFKGKSVSDPLVLQNDLDAVSGATVSSTGFVKAVREGSHYLAETKFNLDIAETDIPFSASAYLILLLFAAAFFAQKMNLKKFQIVVLLSGLVIMGFYLNIPLTMSQLSSLALGFFPDPGSNLLWYVVLGCILFTVVVLGKNLYCAWICPFGALQILLHKISGISLPVPSWLKKSGRTFSAFLAWLSVCVIFVTRNPALGSFEPFAALFSFNGFGLIWVVLPVIIFSSFFIKRFWCRFFCPVGFILNRSCKIQNHLLRQISLTEESTQPNQVHFENKNRIIPNHSKRA